MTRTQDAMVRQGCLALAIAMPRVNLFMIVPFEGAWVCSWTEARDRCGERVSPHVVNHVVIPVLAQREGRALMIRARV